MHARNRFGFTLIELSIVLIITGLLAAGILVGRDLIRAAEIRSVVRDMEAYKTAFYTFQTKYNCLPGDCPHATAFFGAINPDPTLCPGGISDGVLTCNGTGDGIIYGHPSVAGAQSASWETFHFWVQLSAAGLISGQFTGREDGCGAFCATPGLNVPKLKGGSGNAGVIIQFVGSGGEQGPELEDAAFFFPGDYGHPFILGAPYPAYSSRLLTPIFAPEDAYQIDIKTDDGLPATGIVRSLSPLYAPECSTDPDPSLAKYNLTDKGIECPLVFLNRF